MKSAITKTLVSALALTSIQTIGITAQKSTAAQVQRAPAQEAQIQFSDVVARYRTINTNNGVIVESPAEAAQIALQMHQAEFGNRGAIHFINNKGNSDASYDNIEKLNAMARAEVVAAAIEMQKVGGGTLFYAGGVTNSGIGQTVISIQDKAFQQEIFAKYGVRVKSVGLGTMLATMNDGPSGYGENFINKTLDLCVQSIDKDWIHRINGFSVVNLFGPELLARVANTGIKMTGVSMIRGGGAISFQEATQELILQDQLAKELGISGAEMRKVLKIVVQDGLPTSREPSDFLAGKGQQVSVDLLLNLASLGEQSADIRALVDAIGIEYKYYKNGYDLAYEKVLDFEALKVTAARISNRNAKLIVQAKEYAEAMEAVPKLVLAATLTEDEVKSAKAAHQAIIEGVERKFGILPAGEMKALKAKSKGLSKMDPANLTAEQKDILDALNTHQNGVRIRGMADSTRIFTQELLDLSKAYASRAKAGSVTAGFYRGISENLARATEAAVKAGGVVIDMATGKVARAPSRTERAMEVGKKR